MGERNKQLAGFLQHDSNFAEENVVVITAAAAASLRVGLKESERQMEQRSISLSFALASKNVGKIRIKFFAKKEEPSKFPHEAN